MTMTLERFESLLDAYGAAAERWPAAERAAALALVEESEAARHARAEAARLDALLDQAPVAVPSAALQARVLTAVPAGRPDREPARETGPGRLGPRLGRALQACWPAAPAWGSAAALAGALMLGLMVGYVAPPSILGTGFSEDWSVTATQTDWLSFATTEFEETLL